MFRDIRKKKNQISTEAAEQLLREARRGILAVNGREGYPYAIPINYYYDREAQKIYFHGARAGHKVEAIRWGVALCSTTLLSFLRPSASRVFFCTAGQLMRLLTCLIFIFSIACPPY